MSETETCWLRTRGAAERAGITAEQLRALIKQGDGPVCYRVGQHLRFRASDVEAWLESRRVDPEARAS